MIYIEEIYGEKLGFLTGWMQTVLFFPGTSAALGVIFAQQASELLGMSPNNMANVLPIAIGVILFLALLNIIGSSLGGKVQTVATIGKMIPLILIIVFGFIKGQSSEVLNPFVGDGVNASNALGQVLIATLFAYDGWINVGAISGEMKSPEKDLPRAIVGGLSLVMAVYIIINIAYLWVVPASELATVTSPSYISSNKIVWKYRWKSNNCGYINISIWDIEWIFINRFKDTLYIS